MASRLLLPCHHGRPWAVGYFGPLCKISFNERFVRIKEIWKCMDQLIVEEGGCEVEGLSVVFRSSLSLGLANPLFCQRCPEDIGIKILTYREIR